MTPGTVSGEKRQDLLGVSSGSERTDSIFLTAQVRSLESPCLLLLDFPRQQIDPESGLSSHRPRSPWPTPGHCGRDDPQLAVQLAPCSLPAEPGTAAGAMLPPPSHIGALLCSHFQSQTQGPQTGEGSPTGSSRAHCQLQACLAAWAPCSPCPRASAQVSLHRGVHTLASCFLQVSGAPGAFSASQPCSCPHSPSPTLCGFLCCTCF